MPMVFAVTVTGGVIEVAVASLSLVAVNVFAAAEVTT